MAEIPVDIPDGIYEIISDVRGGPASVAQYLQVETQDVRVGGDGRLWEVKKVPGSLALYNLSVLKKYEHSGQEDKQVIATNDQAKNSLWYLIAAFNGFAIAWDHDHKLVWTLENEHEPHSKIVLREIKYGPTKPLPPPVIPSQGFRFVRVDLK